MIFNFDTQQQDAAIAALLLYVVYRSRDKRKFKVTPEMWGQIERFTKASAKRAENLRRFVDVLKPKLHCDSISPRWTRIGMENRVTAMGGGEYAAFSDTVENGREFLTGIFETKLTPNVLNRLYKETTYIVLLVRDRLEREKPIENTFETVEEESL